MADLSDAELESIAEDASEADSEEDVQGPPADTLPVNSQGWKYMVPKSLPLHYYIHTDAVGGVKAKTIKHKVDFNSRDLVTKANKTRRLEMVRAKKRAGIIEQVKRPPTKGREYTAENDNWIISAYRDFARFNNNHRMPASELMRRYNNQFPAEGRSEASLSR